MTKVPLTPSKIFKEYNHPFDLCFLKILENRIIW